MARLCETIKAAGFPADYGQSGGGVATLYAGEPKDQHYPLLVGPGWFDKGDGWLDKDGCFGPDDEGEATPTYIGDLTESQLAQRLVAFLKKNKVPA
jgi:hypothetical protein